MVANEITEMGGRSVVLETVALDRGQEDKVIGRFKADLDEQFREFLSKCEDFKAEIAKETAGTSTMRHSKRMMSTSRNCRRGWIGVWIRSLRRNGELSSIRSPGAPGRWTNMVPRIDQLLNLGALQRTQ